MAGICGGDPEVIDARMTWTLWRAICDEWAEHPPAHMILAAVYLKPKPKKGNLDDLLAMFGGPGPITASAG